MRTCLICGASDNKKLYRIDEFDILQCKQCDFVFTNPLPSSEELAHYYEKQFWTENFVPHISKGRDLKYKVFVKMIKTWFPKNQKIRLLELGCSQGDLLKAVSKDKQFDAIGLDYAKDPVKYAQGLGLNAHLGDLESKNFPPDSIDLIVAIHVIEHLHNPLKTLLEMKRVLRKGGIIFLVTPCVTHIKAKLAGEKWKYYIPPGHLWYFSRKSTKGLLQNVGLQPVVVSCLYHRAHLHILAKKV